MTPHILTPLSALLLCSCAASATPVAAPIAPWERAGEISTIVRADGTTDLRVRGAWRARGYGWIVDIDATGVIRYQAGDTCYAPPRAGGPQSAMDSVSYRYFREIEPGKSVILQLLDGDTNVVFDRLAALPEDCTAEPATDPETVAAAFLDHFERHYAFFDRRPPGHAERASRVTDAIRADMDEAGLWAALASYMHGLSDSHTKLIGTVDGARQRVQDGQGTTLPRIRSGEGGEQRWLVSLIGEAKTRLGESARHEANDRILWGVVDAPGGKKVGYIQVFVMGGFTDHDDFGSPEWATAEMAEFDRVMDEALSAFDGFDAVIVDLSNNRGGWDRVAKALPSRFTDTAFTGFTTVSRGSGLAPFPHLITPAAGARFTGPVWLMTSDVTVSGGELATRAFRQIPNVTQVGTTTRGAFSTPLAKPLPNGWLLELSNEVFAAPDGTVFEETGIAPQRTLEIYPADNPVSGHWNAVMEVAAMAAGQAG